MNNETLKTARGLANYIQVSNLKLIEPHSYPYKDHIGALFTDIILQSGLNYKTIVAPRVNKIIANYPQAYTVDLFKSVLEKQGADIVLNWNNSIKLKRMHYLIEFCVDRKLNYSADVKKFLIESEKNRIEFLRIHGIGKKTLDYLMKLLGIDTIAVDRHIFSYIQKAGIQSNDYDYVKLIVEYAADLLDIPRRSIDFSIWSYMSMKVDNQLSLKFP
jgi:hypothetical protein